MGSLALWWGPTGISVSGLVQTWWWSAPQSLAYKEGALESYVLSYSA